MNRDELFSINRLFQLLIISISLLQNTNASIRKDFYSYFDPFYYKDLFKDLETQYHTKTCSLNNGPNCFNILSLTSLSIPKDITFPTIYSIKQYYDNQIDLISSRIKASPNYIEPINLRNQVEYTLLLTMESFNELTQIKDTYMPSEMVVPYNDFYLILNFIGKIRLTTDHITKQTDDIPNLTYGIIEETEIEIIFNRPLIMKHIYVRKHKDKDNHKNNEGVFTLTGYNNKKVVYVENKPVTIDKWTKVTFNEELINSIRIEKGIDFDNMKVVYKSRLDPDRNGLMDNTLTKKMKKIFRGDKQKDNDHSLHDN